MGGAIGYWLVKSEPSAYSWDRFVSDGQTMWDGVRDWREGERKGLERLERLGERA